MQRLETEPLPQVRDLPIELLLLIVEHVPSINLVWWSSTCDSFHQLIGPVLTERRKQLAATRKIQRWWRIYRGFAFSKRKQVDKVLKSINFKDCPKPEWTYFSIAHEHADIVKITRETSSVEILFRHPTFSVCPRRWSDMKFGLSGMGDLILGFDIVGVVHSLDLAWSRGDTPAKWRGSISGRKRILLERPLFIWDFCFHTLWVALNEDALVEKFSVIRCFVASEESNDMVRNYGDQWSDSGHMYLPEINFY